MGSLVFVVAVILIVIAIKTRWFKRVTKDEDRIIVKAFWDGDDIHEIQNLTDSKILEYSKKYRVVYVIKKNGNYIGFKIFNSINQIIRFPTLEDAYAFKDGDQTIIEQIDDEVSKVTWKNCRFETDITYVDRLNLRVESSDLSRVKKEIADIKAEKEYVGKFIQDFRSDAVIKSDLEFSKYKVRKLTGD